MEAWTARLISAWERSGWTKAELARKSGVPKHSVYKYLAGRVKQPRGDVLNDLADALGVERLWLREGIGPEFKSTAAAGISPQERRLHAELALNGSDHYMARVLEDVIELLVEKGVLEQDDLHDLPSPARELLEYRQQLRATRSGDSDD